MTTTLDNLAGHDGTDAQMILACEVPCSATDRLHIDTQDEHVGSGPNLPDSHRTSDAHSRRAVGDPTSEQANHHSVPTAAAPARVSTSPAPARPFSMPNRPTPEPVTQDPPAPASVASSPMPPTLVLADPLLALAADVLDDLERVRIANENRLRQLTRDETDVDGEERGFGLTLDHPDVARLSALVEALAKAEHDAELQLRRTLRRHPLGPWVKQARGIGEKQAARLLASIGDPYINTLYNRPRTVSELWAYAGYHVLPAGHTGTATHTGCANGAQLRTGQTVRDTQSGFAGSAQPPAGQSAVETQGGIASGNGGNPDHGCHDSHPFIVGVAAHRARGQKANWSAPAKMRAYLVAMSIVKAGGPYREVYDQGRAKYTDATHQVECKRCGPSGKPALVGSPLSAGHQHARALRLVAKEVLKDLWREAKRLHDIHDGQTMCDTQIISAVVDPNLPGATP